MKLKFEIDNQVYDVIIEKKKNKNSYIRIKEDLTIYITTSLWSTKKDIERMLNQNVDALRKMLKKKKTQLEKQESFFYLGKSYDIIEVSIMDKIEIEDNKIYTPSLKELEKWYQQQKEAMQLMEEKGQTYLDDSFHILVRHHIENLKKLENKKETA